MMSEDKNLSNELNTTPIDDELDQQEEALESHIDFANITSRRDERFVAFNLLYSADRSDYSIDLQDIIKNFKHNFDLKLAADSYVFTLVQQTIDQRSELDETIKPLLKGWKLERLGCCTHLILRMALCELQQKDAIPSVVINEAIELAKAFAEKDAYKFINGVLDEYCKQNNIKIPKES